MEILNSYQDKLSQLIHDASIAKETKEVVEYINKAILEVKKIHEKIDIEKKKDDQFVFSIITHKLCDDLESFYIRLNVKFEIYYELAKLTNQFFSMQYLNYLCNDDQIIVYFLNNILNIIENIRGNLIYQLIIRKIHIYMNYIFQKKKTIRKILSELMKSFSIHHSSNFKSFNERLCKSKIPELVGSDNCKDKEQGISELVELISSTVHFSEQFELVYLSAPDILTNLFKESTEEYSKAYSKFGNLLCTLIYPSNFRIGLTPNDGETNKELFSISDVHNITYVNDVHLIENLSEISFLKDKLYKLTFQKEILELNDKIVEVCLLYINNVIKFDKVFPLQFICYLLLRRIYFTFPQFKSDISDYIVTVLANLCKFQGQFEWNTSLESRQFAYYLLAHDKELSMKIKSATAVAPYDIRYDNLIMKQANLTIGLNNIVVIDAGKSIERKIEVSDKESIVYISFGMDEDEERDINVMFNKYDSNTNKWINIFAQENVEFSDGANKIILYAKEPGLYRIVFDNSHSWVYKRKILYRFVFLKPLTEDES